MIRLERYSLTGRTVARFLFGAKDAVIHRMTGQAVIDPTTATTTGLFNIRKYDWDTELLAATGVTLNRLPHVVPADAVVGPLLGAPAAALGLRPGVPVFNGAGDGAAATWGALADCPQSAYVHIGTTGWVAATVTLSEANPPRDIYTLADPIHVDRAILISPFLNAGSALDWLSEVTSVTVETLLDNAERERPGPLFLPYLSVSARRSRTKPCAVPFLASTANTDRARSAERYWRASPSRSDIGANFKIDSAACDSYLALFNVSKILPFIRRAISEAGSGFWHSDSGLSQKLELGNISNRLRAAAPRQVSGSFT